MDAALDKVVAARSPRQGRRVVPGTGMALAILVYAQLISAAQTMTGLGALDMAAKGQGLLVHGRLI